MRAATALALAVAGSLLASPVASAQQGYKWPGERVPYFNAAKRYRAEVATAVKAWNASGVELRWVKASRSTAAQRGVVFDVDNRAVALHGGPGVLGVAEVRVTGRRATGGIHLISTLFKQPVAGPKRQAVQVIAHEMGHAIGLSHDDRGCATMNTQVNGRCKLPPERWRYACQILRPVDVRRAVKLHGGKVRLKPGPVFCARPRPPRVTGLAVVLGDDERTPKVSWRNPARSFAEVEVNRGDRNGPCPDPDEPGFLGDARRGTVQSIEDDSFIGDPGRFCYSAVTIDDFGRRSLPATFLWDFSGSAPGADFTWDEDFDPLSIAFSDVSFDPESDIVARTWNFGDGSAPLQEGEDGGEPIHTFPAAGTYQVTLTVTDSVGHTASVTLPVTVE
jgi:hypothetical protein